MDEVCCIKIELLLHTFPLPCSIFVFIVYIIQGVKDKKGYEAVSCNGPLQRTSTPKPEILIPPNMVLSFLIPS